MKLFEFRRLCAVLCALSTVWLAGCGSVYSNYREVEQLLVIETMGFDLMPDGVRLSMASGVKGGGGKEPVRLTGSGDSISAAMDQARNFSFEDELFCSQTNGILIGEKAAEKSLEPFLAYICQSPILRTDVPVFIIKGGSAYDAIMNCGDSRHGVSEILQGVTEYLEYRGASHIFNASELVRSSLRHGSALACVLEYTDSKEPPSGKARSGETKNAQDIGSGAVGSRNDGAGQTEGTEGSGSSGGEDEANALQTPAKTLAVAGFAVLKDNRLISYIDNDQAVGVSFLIGEVGISTVELADGGGNPVVLEINDGSSRVFPRWNSDGSLRGIDIHALVHATVTEINDDADLSDRDYTQQLTGALEAFLRERMAQVLRLSASLQSDFLGLEARVEQAEPVLTALMQEDFAQMLPGLELNLSVSAQLSHTNDMKESLT